MNPSDAGPGGSTSTLPCGATTCAIPGQTCCVKQTNAGTSYSCTASGGTCTVADAGGGGNGGNTTGLQCSGAANCANGTVCCVQQINNAVTSSCMASCPANSAQLCDPNATPTGCSASAPCSTQNIGDWGLPPTYGTCGGQGN